MILRCTFCGLESDDLRIVSRAIVRLDEAKPNGHRYEWLPRCRDRQACDLRRIEAESAKDDVVLA